MMPNPSEVVGMGVLSFMHATYQYLSESVRKSGGLEGSGERRDE
jgi:hypothetical protein